MGTRDQRRSPRVQVGLPVEISIREAADGSVLALGQGLANDVSCHGLRLTVSQPKVGDYHLFYSFHDNRGQVIYLTVPTSQPVAGSGKRVDGVDRAAATAAEAPPPFAMPVRPVWFDRNLGHPDRPFLLGLEFLEEPPPLFVKWLQAQVAACQSPEKKSWWSRLWSG